MRAENSPNKTQTQLAMWAQETFNLAKRPAQNTMDMIAKDTHEAKTTVFRITTKFLETGSVTRKPGSGSMKGLRDIKMGLRIFKSIGNNPRQSERDLV